MFFDKLIRFIESREPGFASRIRGVDTHILDNMEDRIGIRLPAAYREYLKIFGEESGGFDAFPAYLSRVSDLGTYQPKSSLEFAYDNKRYHKIAICVDPRRDEPLDFFLDLLRGDTDDAPLVTFEDQSGLPKEEQAEVKPIDVQYWFGDIVHLAALRQYELYRRMHQARVSVTSRFTPENEASWMDQGVWWTQVCDVVAAWSFDEPFSGRAFRCGVCPEAVFIAERILNGTTPIILRIGTDDARELARREEQLRDYLEVIGD